MKMMIARALSLAVLLASMQGRATGETPPAAARPTISPATLDDTLNVSGDPIAARGDNRRLAIAVSIGGQGPFRFLVDSGADRTVVGAALAQRIGLPPEGNVVLNSIAGRSVVDTVRMEGLRVGDSTIPLVIAPSLPEAWLGAQGIVGIDALAEQKLMLDFEQRSVTIEPKRREVPVGDDEIVVVARRRHGQLLLTEVAVGGIDLLAIIDSGSEITVGNQALLERVSRLRHPPTATPIRITSVTGQSVEASLIVLPRLRIGRLELLAVPVAFADVPPFALFGVADRPALLLGTDTLAAFRRVSLDFARRRVRFQMRG
ncbi:retroviral-like aspartic protease family protein [Sphingomonas nostoxanthinifaciens]|uniref:retroviral-like aspartic protease family protein n=1 Tax=Sphingomonas nostoxanthinifaciens TaxID=2872652 RepID=UPI001CC1F8C6|nr:retroviral-like aspartic protease family protein [Sphingomonas nostoxanthinifaciens]UAK23493.1 aspartyl protease family protein [Sphingomonas nostoxanthinifaciens]